MHQAVGVSHPLDASPPFFSAVALPRRRPFPPPQRCQSRAPQLSRGSSRSRTEVGWWSMRATNVEGEAPYAFCLMVTVSRLRHHSRGVPHLLRHRFSTLLLATKHAGSPVIAVAGASELGGEDRRRRWRESQGIQS
jgi:hypothetical protein